MEIREITRELLAEARETGPTTVTGGGTEDVEGWSWTSVWRHEGATPGDASADPTGTF